MNGVEIDGQVLGILATMAAAAAGVVRLIEYLVHLAVRKRSGADQGFDLQVDSFRRDTLDVLNRVDRSLLSLSVQLEKLHTGLERNNSLLTPRRAAAASRRGD
jgi:hypothetical protein